MADGPTISEVVQNRYWNERDARVLMTAWQQSGKSLAKFAKELALNRSRLSRWARRLKSQSGTEMRFHRVRVVAPVREEHAPDAIEVLLVDGRRLRVPAGFAADDLAKVLAVLEGRRSC